MEISDIYFEITSDNNYKGIKIKGFDYNYSGIVTNNFHYMCEIQQIWPQLKPNNLLSTFQKFCYFRTYNINNKTMNIPLNNNTIYKH